MDDWIAFWNSKHAIYVNARHRDVHYRGLAQDILVHVGAGARILDYGCGEALHADLIAAPAAQLTLCEAVSSLRAGLSRRFSGNPRILVCSTEDVAKLPDGSFDLVIMHSVAQYLTPEELDGVLALFHRLLAPDGVLILGDIVPPNVSAATDALALLRFALAKGFLGAAVVGLARTLASDYRRLRSQLGLTCYSETETVEKLSRAGFSAHRQPVNIGHDTARMTFLAKRAPVSSENGSEGPSAASGEGSNCRLSSSLAMPYQDNHSGGALPGG
jgi:SAM-dependent methyltransferase